MLSRYVIYILMFAVLGAVLYAWGLKKAQSQSQELARMLYAKCCKIVKKELKKKEYLRKNEIEQLIKDVQVGQFYSKNKMGVTNPKEFINPFLEYMTKNEILREDMIKGKKVYYLKKILTFIGQHVILIKCNEAMGPCRWILCG
ncbi:MAG: hypothetical protein ACLROG_13685 [Coprococcus phoceensis]